MGYDQALVIGHVDEELICPICADVLEAPLQSPTCEHAFCRNCIEKWMQEKQICPVDRSDLLPFHLVSVSRLMRNMLGRLRIKCCFEENGCSFMMPLEVYRSHVANCRSNPNVVVLCTRGCGMKLPKNELDLHNCIVELRERLQSHLSVITELRNMQSQQERRLTEHRRELELVQYYVSALRSSNPVMQNVGDQIDRFAVMRWGRSLPLSSVRNWGGLISTPDRPMHMMVRDGLRASGCPMHLINVLLEFCHEDGWPEGLSSLPSRRSNLQRLSQFVTRVLPIVVTPKPCVIILGGENAHMPENLRPVLGMIIVFVDGVDEAGADSLPLPDSDYL